MTVESTRSARRRWSRTLATTGLAALCLTVPLAVPALAQTTALCATPGKDGPLVVPASGIVNTYYPGTVSVPAGGTTLTLGTPVGNTAQAISAGDLLLVIQMQDAGIDATNTNSYGDGVTGDPASGATAVNAAGQYEFVVAQSALAAGATGTVTVLGSGTGNGLLRPYTTAAATTTQGQRRYQVIRVPQYSSATLTSAVTALPWDGAAGGVLAFDVAGTANLNGATISVSGQGFRGGGGRNLQGGTATTTTTAPTNTDYRYPTSPLTSTVGRHGSKGEGTAGTPRVINGSLTAVPAVADTGTEGYPNGSAGQGAPGNAGGGGTDDSAANANNSGGGGGSNGGAGGRGGDGYNASDTVSIPHTGGFGGADFASATTARVVLGGGGGAGSSNNNFGPGQSAAYTSGARGGGIVMIRAGTLTGTGTINANGLDAADYNGNDAAGGGGAGGSVLVYAATATATLTANARGGAGGDADITTFTTPHGPGGGGGGGVIYTSMTATTSVTGGANGLTPLSATTALPLTGTTSSAFGSTAGAVGETGTLAAQPTDTGVGPTVNCIPVLTVLKTTSTPTRVAGTDTTATYTITVSNAAGGADATGLSISDALPTPFTYASTTGTPALSGGATRTSTTTPAAGATTPNWGSFAVPGGGSVTLTFTVNLNAATAGTYNNPATATYLDPARTTTTGTTTRTYDTTLPGEDVKIGLTISGRVFGDPNLNGTVDTGETGLTGVTVGLYDAAGTALLSTALTDATGTYSFLVGANTTYTVRAISPSGQGPTSPSPASRSVAMTTTSVTNQNFGFTATPACSAILAVGFTGTAVANLYAVDAGSGVPTTIRALSAQTAAMARDPLTGRVYYIGYATYASTAPQLRYVDLTTGEDVLAATLATEATAITRMAIDKNGTGYAMIGNGSKLFSFTTGGTTSMVTNLGSVTTSSGVAIANYGTGDMAFDANGVLWAVFTDSQTGSATLGQAILFTIDPATRVATPLDNVTVNGTVVALTLNGLAFDAAGNLYGSSSLTGGSYDTYRINPANANATKLNAAANTNPLTDLGSCVYPTITPAMAITKTASPANAKPGDTITYTITVTNSGTAAATGVSLADAIPANTTYVAGSTTTGGTATTDGPGSSMPYATGGAIGSAGSFPSVITVGAGKEVVVTFKVTVNTPYPDGAPGVSNTATVTYSGGPAGGLNSLPATTGVGTDLRVTKTGPQYVSAGTAVTYTVTVTNAGLRGANGAVVRDPAVVNFTATGVTCSATGGAVCPTGLTVATLHSGATITAFPAGGALSLNVTGTAGGGTIVNGASVSIPSTLPDLDGSNDAASATTQVINLVLTKEVRNCGAIAEGATCPATATWEKTGTGRPGDVLEYRISYTNTGSANARGVVIQDSVPGNTAADLNGYAAGRGVSWTVGTAAPTLLTSLVGTPARDDAGSLTATQLILDVGIVTPGASGSVSFRSVIR